MPLTPYEIDLFMIRMNSYFVIFRQNAAQLEQRRVSEHLVIRDTVSLCLSFIESSQRH